MRKVVMADGNIDLISDAPVSNLIIDADDAVVGVVVQRGDTQERVRAKKVILACNGFGGNHTMVAQYIPAMKDALYFGSEGNTGEGILWGIELGAATAFMDAYQAHNSVAVPVGVLISYALITEGGIQVNKHGQRFGTEMQGYSERALEVLAQPDGFVWDIYDERLHRLGMKFDEYREGFAAGAIKSADTIEQLAEILGIDVEGTAQTFNAYNAAARGEQPDAMGREHCTELHAPLYGVKVTGALFHTQGGLTVDFDARVLKADGSVIPNLYAGGGVAAGVSGHGAAGYLSGNGLLTALGYGMLAGRDAARRIR
ncbi:MAG: FAD-binding protein [Chloroflexi bacterium]|nr:MAG: FAD-binding protein [Chloroflexota bacterium]